MVWLLKFCRTICGKDVNVFVVFNCFVTLDDRFNVSLISFLGAPTKLRKAALSHVCPSAHVEHSCFRWTDFNENCYWNIFRKSVEKIQISLKSEKNNENGS